MHRLTTPLHSLTDAHKVSRSSASLEHTQLNLCTSLACSNHVADLRADDQACRLLSIISNPVLCAAILAGSAIGSAAAIGCGDGRRPQKGRQRRRRLADGRRGSAAGLDAGLQLRARYGRGAGAGTACARVPGGCCAGGVGPGGGRLVRLASCCRGAKT